MTLTFDLLTLKVVFELC